MSSKPQKFGLFWVTDSDDSENWFIVSPIPNTTEVTKVFGEENIAAFLAEEFHTRYEGFSNDLVFEQDNMFHEQCTAHLVTTFTLDDLTISMIEESIRWHGTAQEELAYWDGEMQDVAEKIMKPAFINAIGGLSNVFTLCAQLQPNMEVDTSIFKRSTTQSQINDLYACFFRSMCQRHTTVMGYAPFHAQVELLETLGFSIIDDGSKSLIRTVVYNGCMYVEGDMESQIN